MRSEKILNKWKKALKKGNKFLEKGNIEMNKCDKYKQLYIKAVIAENKR